LQPLLLDKGLPHVVAQGLAALGIEANAVGQPGAPPDNSSDEDNCKWCVEHRAVLVTNDRGKGDKEILNALANHRVHAIFVYGDLQTGPPHELARALLNAEGKIEKWVDSRRLLGHRLRPSGGLENRRR